MSFEDINRRLDNVGGQWVKLNDEGNELRGELVALEYRPLLDFNTKQPVLSKRGSAREELVVTVRIDEADRTGADDDGIRKASLKESGQFALIDAIKASGRPAEAGARIGIRCLGRATTMEQPRYEAGYKPPVLTRTASDLV